MEYDRYGRKFSIWFDVNGKGQIVWTKECRGYTCLSNPSDLETKEAVEVKASMKLLDILLKSMIPYFHGSPLSNNLSTMVKKKKLSNTLTEIIVSAHPYTGNDIPEVISILCDRNIYPNISLSDVYKIIDSLDFLSYVICVESDPESGACLVVFKELPISYSYSTDTCSTQPRTDFRKAYQRFNESRTVFMTPAQYDRFMSDEMKSRVEFRSVLPDRIEVVFREDAIKKVLLKWTLFERNMLN
jgi:hypothetical protein